MIERNILNMTLQKIRPCILSGPSWGFDEMEVINTMIRAAIMKSAEKKSVYEIIPRAPLFVSVEGFAKLLSGHDII